MHRQLHVLNGGVSSESGTEMAIVDTFTKVIFGQDADYDEQELAIVAALRTAEPLLARDSFPQMSMYLRSLGVREMVALVERVRLQLPPVVALANAQSCGMEPGQLNG